MVLFKTYKDGSTPEIAVIGAGLSGLCVGVQLQRMLQLTTYKIFEADSDIGGTWLQNTYPGCACDNLSHLYNYSFAPNYDWSRKYVPQKEILEYLRSTAHMYNIYDKIQFRSKVSRMQWNEDRQKWVLNWSNLATGEEAVLEVDVVIHATGLFRIPRIPQEFAQFKGELWHSARWRWDVDLTGKRVGIVGSGASAIQIVPGIVDKVKNLEVYGRSASYIMPQFDAQYSNFWKTLFRRLPLFHTIYVTVWHYLFDSLFLVYRRTWPSSFHRALFYLIIWWHRRRQTPDPTLRQKLVPTRLLGSKRTVLSNTYLPALSKPNVEYHSDDIIKVEGNKITTADGQTQELDVLILATGFDTAANYPVGQWIGRDGIDIAESWIPSPRTYYGACTPGAPNCFMAWGPMSGTFHQPLTSLLEQQVMFMVKSLSLMMEHGYSSLEITERATTEFIKLSDEKAALAVPFGPTKATTQTAKKPLSSLKYWWGTLAEFNLRLSRFSSELFTGTGVHGPVQV
ncbi:hypothetical protein BGZ70_002886 [Mortierella alpina]|uniref:Uncharacterized protein n=1 Tax=Mortierella alpina TaxID=64518 RepID=A0A9P6ITA8_MORAP|nr:hypothetical protein BGZ70_002886 [Mortierella alpina]